MALAGIAGLEPTNVGIKIRCLTDLAISHYERIKQNNVVVEDSSYPISIKKYVGWIVGFEPTTFSATN